MLSKLFKKAHELTKEMKKKYPEVDYQVQFGLYVSFLFEEGEEEEEEVQMTELEGTAKQIAWAEDIRKEKLEDFERWVVRWEQKWEKENNQEELTYIDELRKSIYKVADSSKWIWLDQVCEDFHLLLSPRRREKQMKILENFF